MTYEKKSKAEKCEHIGIPSKNSIFSLKKDISGNFTKWFNLNGHHANITNDEREVSYEPKTNKAKIHQRIQERRRQTTH